MNRIVFSRLGSLLAAFAAMTCSGGTTPAARPHAAVTAQHSASPTTTPQQSGVTSRLQAVSPVDEEVVWVSGVAGAFAVTSDGGRTWRAGTVPGAEKLQFRDVQGVSEDVAYLLAAGAGSNSRIYKTNDGGKTWQLQFQAPPDPNFFYDCFAFWTPERGLAMADGKDGRFPALRTVNGRTWKDIGDHLPAAQPNEGAFAASGTCVATQGERRAWIVTTSSRVFASADGGERWTTSTAPIAGGTGTAGIFTVAFRDASHGIVGGGDFVGAGVVDNVARSSDGGKSWQRTARAPVTGAVFGLSYARSAGEDDEDEEDAASRTVVVTGPGGSAWTPDEGETWHTLSGASGYWAVAFASERVGWLVGTNGRILRIDF